MFTLHRQITIPTELETAWDFIRNPANLNLITPEDMAFQIMTNLTDEMREGMMIEYRVKLPLLGTRPWISRISDVVPKHSFADEQVKGPYKYWHHHHVIEPVDQGVLFTDHITYQPPFGAIGKLAQVLFIRSELERIFDYRSLRLSELLAD